MSTIVPPPRSAPIPPPPGGAQILTVNVPVPPPSLAQLSLGALIEGRAIAGETKGVYLLQTPLGDFSIQTAVPLPKNAALVLQVQSLGMRGQLLLTSIDGKSPSQFFPDLPARTGQKAAAVTAKSPPLFPVNLTVGTKVRATLLGSLPAPVGKPKGGGLQTPALKTPSPGAKTPVSFLKGAASESGVKAAIGNIQTMAAKALSQVGINRPGLNRFAGSSLNPALRAGLKGGAKAGGVGGGGLPPGTHITVKIVALEPAGPAFATPLKTTPPGTPSLAIGQTLNGKVIGATPQGRPIVQTHAGPISLETRSPLPKGVNVTLEITGKAVVPGRSDAIPLRLREGIIQSREWPALNEAVRLLQGVNPSAAQHLTQVLIPQPNAQLSANILFFISALRGGDLKGWLGNETDKALGKAKSSLRTRLGDEFRQLGRSMEETPKADFRVIPVPFLAGAEIEQLRLFIKRPDDEDDDAPEGEGGTRFVIDLDLSRLGRMQLDGNVRERNGHFDLTVRSAHPLPAEIRNGIRTVFQQANEVTGIKGAIFFQAAPPHFIEIPSAHGQEEIPGLMV